MGSASARIGSRERSPRRGGGRAGALCTPAFDIAANPATIGTLMRGADAGTRIRLADALQRRHGNAAVQRLLAPTAALPLQRWPVTLPPETADCGIVVTYLDKNSPYRADSGWARTNASFSWGGDPSFTEANGVITATVANPTVAKTVTVDMPSWAPTSPAMATGWSAMTGALRAHEARHEAIATTWETTLRSRLRSLSVTVPHRTTAAFIAAVQTAWRGWIADHQAAQNAIDPYTAILSCAGDEPEAETGTAPGVEGETGAAEGG